MQVPCQSQRWVGTSRLTLALIGALGLCACGAEPTEGGPTLVFSEPGDATAALADAARGAHDSDSAQSPDAGVVDAYPADSSSPDAGALDAGALDGGPPDAGAADSGAADVADATSADGGALDTGSGDVGAADAAAVDSGALDAGAVDTAAADIGTVDAGTVDAGTNDAGTNDGGTNDAAPADGGGCKTKPEVCDGIDNDCDGATDEGGAALCGDGEVCTIDTCAGKAGCVHKPSPPANACAGGTVVAGRCYHATKASAKWADAESACVKWGGHLASIGSSAENDAVQARAKATCGIAIYWIGLNDLKKEGSWQWTDGSAYGYSSWAPGEPNDFFGEDVVAAYQDGKWNDGDKDDKQSCYVCERAASTACSDDDPCTHSDACQKTGVCAGQKVSCNDGNSCTADGCDAKGGCTHAKVKDGTTCGAGGACKAGVCAVGTSDQPGKTCLAILQAKSGAKSGVYWLDPDGAGPAKKFRAWCDMTFAGGGWTLLMKLDGKKTTFTYASGLWTNTSTHNAGSVDLSLHEAKLASFWTVPFSAMRLGMRVNGATKWITVPFKASNLRAALASGKHKPTKVGRSKWKSLISFSSLQKNCNQEGLNAGASTSRVRIGIVGNGEKDCKTPDSRLGFGGAGGSCYQDTKNSCGNTARCGGDLGVRNTKGFGFILVR